jgi:uncharacterized membrane protein
LIQKEKFDVDDIFLQLANVFVFYGVGYSALHGDKIGVQLLGIFTLFNAFIHFVVSIIVYKQKTADKQLLYMISGLALVFITIAIPVQLNGNWVTLLWAGEAALLFWIGRSKQAQIYERFSYVLMLLAFICLIQDWGAFYLNYNFKIKFIPLLNINFLSSVLFIGAFSFINFINNKSEYNKSTEGNNDLIKIINIAIPSILLFTLYYSFYMEITLYFDQLYNNSVIKSIINGNTSYYWNPDILQYKSVWLINYSLLFVSVLSLVNIKFFKNSYLGYVNLVLNVFAIMVFFSGSLLAISQLRTSFLEQTFSQYYQISSFNLGIRYISLVFFSTTLFACYKYIQQNYISKDLKIAFDFVLHMSILWTASSELINWMEIARSTQSYKLGLSILWGFYSLLLIVRGIWKSKKHLRIGAIALFAVTLVKLFFYDIMELETIAKTIVFVLLGVLLLVISFLYNKYKSIITDEKDE